MTFGTCPSAKRQVIHSKDQENRPISIFFETAPSVASPPPVTCSPNQHSSLPTNDLYYLLAPSPRTAASPADGHSHFRSYSCQE
jgi:hypothetical protein